MSLRKLKDCDWGKKPCTSPYHLPPSMISLQPGTYEHACEACGHRTVFVVPAMFAVSTAMKTPNFGNGWL